MQIGTFISDEYSTYTSTIRTLTLNVRGGVEPCDRDNDKAPRPVTVDGLELHAAGASLADERRLPVAPS